MNKFSHTKEIVQRIRNETDTAVLFYSATGKDSIALLDMLANTFPRVICYFMYFVKGLHHIEIYINTAINRYPNIEVRQIPHFMLSNIRRSVVFCFPQPETRIQKNSDIEAEIRKETGEKYIFSGMKGEDGFLKRMRLKGFEDFTDHKGNVYPLALWTNKEVLRYISDNNLQTPIVYSVEYRPRVNKIGRSNPAKSGGIAFDLDVFLWLRDNYPCDLQMIYDEFPLSKQILWRYDKGMDK